MLSEIVINVLASAILLVFGYFGGQYRERKSHQGKNLEEYEFYPFALDENILSKDEYEKALAGKRHLVLTATFMVVEVIGGILSGSLALLADAGHMLTDTMALTLAAVAFGVSARPADSKRSYGYHRFQILAAFVNGLSLLLIVGWILIEAVRRLISPPDVMGKTMLIVASAGLLVNIVAFIILHGGDRENLNIRGAALHVAGDLLGSIDEARTSCSKARRNGLIRTACKTGWSNGYPPSTVSTMCTCGD
jgi:Co/Zn/Cd efflux system component